MAERTLHIVQKIEGRFAGETHITRTEAIKKMSDAIATPYFEGVFSCENEAIEEYAKAALNALLGD